MSTLPPEQWEPSLFPDGEFGRFGNTYRSILSLAVGDSLDLAKVVEGAPNLKSAYVWRTKDGWEFRVASYSGTYGFSVEPDELKDDKGLFDTILKSADVDPPFPDEQKCACGCGAPSKSEFLPGHEDRYDAEPSPIVPAEDEESDVAPEAEVAPTLPEEVPEGESVPDVEPEVDTPDAAQSPELPAAERKEPDEYSKYLAQAIFNPQKVAEEADESEDDELIAQADIDAYIDQMIDPLNYVPSDDRYSIAVEMAGVKDRYAKEDPFKDMRTCACGCGGPGPVFGNYLVGHDLRHRSWLMSQIRKGDGHAFQVLKNLGWLRYLYPDFRLPPDFSPEDKTLKRVSGRLTNEMKPSLNRKNVYMLAFKLALADTGYYSEDTNLSDLTVAQSARLSNLWRNKADYIKKAEAVLDSIDVGGSLITIAGQIYALVMTNAIRAGFTDIKYVGYLRYPNGTKHFSPSKVRKMEDEDQLSLVYEPEYTRYRDTMEFVGEEFDPKAKFFNYLAMNIAAGKKPDWVESSSDDAWMTAAQSIPNLPKAARPYIAKWWLEHGYKAAEQNPPREFILLAKGVADYTATHAKDIVENVNFGYKSGDVIVASLKNTKKQVLWYNDFLMDVTRVIDGDVYGRLRMNEDNRNNMSNERWKDSATWAGLLDDTQPKEVKIDSDQIVWLSPK